MSTRVSNDQLEVLLEYLLEHPAIARGVGLGSRSKAAVENQLSDLAHKLNAFGSGSTKSGGRWKKYWTDLKHKSKARVAKRKREVLGTGGGPGSQDGLTGVDKKVLAIIGEQAVFGDSKHRIPLSRTEAETLGQSNDVLRVRVAIPHDEVDILPIANSSPIVNSPSRRGTTQDYTEHNIEAGPSNSTNQNITTDNNLNYQVPQQPQMGVFQKKLHGENELSTNFDS